MSKKFEKNNGYRILIKQELQRIILVHVLCVCMFAVLNQGKDRLKFMMLGFLIFHSEKNISIYTNFSLYQKKF